MATGTKLAGTIDAGLIDLRKQEDALAEHLRSAAETIKGRRSDQAAAYRELSSMRLDAIASGNVADTLDAAERAAVQLLEESGAARKELEASIADSRKRIAAIETEIDAQGDAVAAAEQALDVAEAKLQSKLAKSQAYRDQAAATENAVRVADEAERKTALSEEDRVEKGKPYEADPLFMYLWSRGFGTSDYRSWGIIKALDQWVARLCDYQGARPNYAMLLEIPERLRVHTDRVAEKAEQAVDALAAAEQEARDADGVTALENALQSERDGLEELGQDLERATEALTAQELELGKFDRGEDQNSLQAFEVVAQELRRDSLRRLQHEALLTPDPRDDQLVDRIEELEAQIDQAEEDVAMRQQSLRVLADRRAELEKVRTDFREKRYHTNDFTFNDYGALEALLGGLLRGAVTGSQYWRELHRNAARRKPPRSNFDFGSRGYRRSSTSWGGGSTRSSGGFRTGGSFGGRSSGFKTGGGF